MRESEIESYFTKLVRKHGGIAYKFVSPGNRGVPDRIVIFPSLASFVELKSENGGLRTAQKIQKRRLSKLDFEVQVISSKEQAKTWVELTASLSKLMVGR